MKIGVIFLVLWFSSSFANDLNKDLQMLTINLSALYKHTEEAIPEEPVIDERLADEIIKKHPEISTNVAQLETFIKDEWPKMAFYTAEPFADIDDAYSNLISDNPALAALEKNFATTGLQPGVQKKLRDINTYIHNTLILEAKEILESDLDVFGSVSDWTLMRMYRAGAYRKLLEEKFQTRWNAAMERDYHTVVAMGSQLKEMQDKIGIAFYSGLLQDLLKSLNDNNLRDRFEIHTPGLLLLYGDQLEGGNENPAYVPYFNGIGKKISDLLKKPDIRTISLVAATLNSMQPLWPKSYNPNAWRAALTDLGSIMVAKTDKVKQIVDEILGIHLVPTPSYEILNFYHEMLEGIEEAYTLGGGGSLGLTRYGTGIDKLMVDAAPAYFSKAYGNYITALVTRPQELSDEDFMKVVYPLKRKIDLTRSIDHRRPDAFNAAKKQAWNGEVARIKTIPDAAEKKRQAQRALAIINALFYGQPEKFLDPTIVNELNTIIKA